MVSVRNAVESVDDRALKAFLKVKEDVKHLKSEIIDVRRRTDVLDDNTRNKLYRLQSLNLGQFVKDTEEGIKTLNERLEVIEDQLMQKRTEAEQFKSEISYQSRENARLSKKVEKLEEESKLNKTDLRETKRGLNSKVLDELTIYNKEYTEIQKENAKLKRDVDKQTEEIVKLKEILRTKSVNSDQEVRELRREMLEKERVMEKEIREIRKLLDSNYSSVQSSKSSTKKFRQTERDQEEVASRLENMESEDKESKKSFLKWIVSKDKDLDSIEEVKNNE